jgi:16S rRNA (cytosine967-C5)-methyltransferase
MRSGKDQGLSVPGSPDGIPPAARAPAPARPARNATIHPARDAVMRHAAKQCERFPQLELAPLQLPPMDERDAALAHAIWDVVVRRWLTLGYLLNLKIDQPLEAIESPVRAALLVGAAQIFFLDRVPAYAAIDHAVEWAKATVRPGAGGLVNAVLRRMSELKLEGTVEYSNTRDKLPTGDGQAIKLASPVLPDEDALRLAVVTSHPLPLLRDWAKRFGIDAARKAALHALAPAPTVLNTLHAEPSTLPGPELIGAHDEPGCKVWLGTHEQLRELLASREDLWVQDASSCGAVRSVSDLHPNLVIDLCAGQGTKTRQLCATFPSAHVVACDTDLRRATTLLGVFAHRRSVRVKEIDEVLGEYAGQADLILLDVPCSNTGVLARRPEAKYRHTDASIAELVAIQKSIVERAVTLLGDRPNAAILYSTCSLDARENQEVALWACEKFNLVASRQRQQLPTGGPGQPGSRYRDGAYSVLLARKAM